MRPINASRVYTTDVKYWSKDTSSLLLNTKNGFFYNWYPVTEDVNLGNSLTGLILSLLSLPDDYKSLALSSTDTMVFSSVWSWMLNILVNKSLNNNMSMALYLHMIPIFNPYLIFVQLWENPFIHTLKSQDPVASRKHSVQELLIPAPVC